MEEKNNIEEINNAIEEISEENENEKTLNAIKEDIKITEDLPAIPLKAQENLEKWQNHKKEWDNVDDAIKLIDSGLEQAETTYEVKTYLKYTKNQLIEEYFKVCKEKGIIVKLTENKLKKIKKCDIIDIINKIKINKETDDNINRKTNFIDEIPSTKKQVSNLEKKYLAKGLYNMNIMATFALETVNGLYSKKTGFDISGMSIELEKPKAEKEQMPIFLSMVDQYPIISSYLGNAALQYSAYMTKTGIQQASKNKKFFPRNNTPKPARNIDIPKNNVHIPKNIPKTKKDTGWITLRGHRIRDPSSFTISTN